MKATYRLQQGLIVALLFFLHARNSKAKVATNTSLLVTLAPATGQSNASFAQLTAVLFTGNANVSMARTDIITFSDKETSLGTARLTAINASSTPGTYAGFLIAILPNGDHSLTASYSGNQDFEPSASIPLQVTAGGAKPLKHDTPVPTPFPQNAGSEESLGVRMQEAEDPARSTQRFKNIAQDPSFQKGTTNWAVQGSSGVSASSTGGSNNAAVKLGQGGYIWQGIWTGISPSTAYVLDAAAWVDSGHGLAGVTFYSGAGAKLSSAGMKIAATIGGSVSRGVFPAPPGAYFAAIWAGNWAGGGQLQVSSIQFGPMLDGALGVDCSVIWRNLSTNGVGINTNYLMDISPEWRNAGGPAFQDSLQAMGVASLRYPGGEEANSYEWAPPPYGPATKPKPVLTTTYGFPGGDFLFYDRYRRQFQGSVMDFDQLMAIAAALNVTDPYIVLNHDSVNVLGRYADPAWGYNSLKAAAVAWLKYIVSKQYSVRHFELSNESWKTCQAAQYAWALLDWAPALKQAHPTALIGANGPAGRTELGERDQGIAWWPQVLGAASSVIDFVATHPYPVYGWDYTDYVAGNYDTLQQGVIEADIAIQSFAAPKDRDRIRIAVTETGVIDWRNKWQNGQADVGHALVAFDSMATVLSHPRVDVAHFWTTRWRYGGFAESNNPGSVADTLNEDNSLTALGKAMVLVGKFFKGGSLLQSGSSQTVRTWALLPPGQNLTLILLNKALTTTQQDLSLGACGNATSAKLVWLLNGTSPIDPNPSLSPMASVSYPVQGGRLSVALPPTSISVLQL